jgi:nitrite transporter NirC
MGFGGVVLFTLRSYADPAWAYLIMRIVFIATVAAILFADGELFTSTAFAMPFAVLRRRVSVSDMLAACFLAWGGNLVGAASVAALVHLSGGGALLHDGEIDFFSVMENREAIGAVELFLRAFACNWLLCLAIWCGSYSQNPARKIAAIVAPLCLFLLPGIEEHSVGSTFTFSLALMGDHPSAITWLGAAHNIVWTIIGNLAGAVAFAAGAVWLGSVIRFGRTDVERRPRSAEAAAPARRHEDASKVPVASEEM